MEVKLTAFSLKHFDRKSHGTKINKMNMNINIWILKEDLLKFTTMYKYASEIKDDSSDETRIYAIQSYSVPYYEKNPNKNGGNDLHTVQLTIPIDVYLNLEGAKI
jgi:hypothetical protein